MCALENLVVEADIGCIHWWKQRARQLDCAVIILGPDVFWYDKWEVGTDHPYANKERTTGCDGCIHCGNHFSRSIVIHKLVTPTLRVSSCRTDIKVTTASGFARVAVIWWVRCDRILSIIRVCACSLVLTPAQWLIKIQRMSWVVELGMACCREAVLLEVLRE